MNDRSGIELADDLDFQYLRDIHQHLPKNR